MGAAASDVRSYALDNAAAKLQALGQEQTATDTLSVTSLDGTATQAITVTISGANDAASISCPVTRAVAEDGTQTATGTLAISDADTGQAGFASSTTSTLIYGAFNFTRLPGRGTTRSTTVPPPCRRWGRGRPGPTC